MRTTCCGGPTQCTDCPYTVPLSIPSRPAGRASAEFDRQIEALRAEAKSADDQTQQARYRNDKGSEQWHMGVAHGLRIAIDHLNGLRPNAD